MKNTKGIEKRIFSELGEYTISMISHGASQNSLSFVVEKFNLDSVVKTLHKSFFED